MAMVSLLCACGHSPSMNVENFDQHLHAEQDTVGTNMSYIPHSTKGFWCTAMFCSARKVQCEVTKKRIDKPTDCTFQEKAACFDTLANGSWVTYCYTEMKWCEVGRSRLLREEKG